MTDIHHYYHNSEQLHDTLSLEIGTPGKGGVIKIKGDADNPDQFMRRIERAVALRAYAQEFQNGDLPAPKLGDISPEQQRKDMAAMEDY